MTLQELAAEVQQQHEDDAARAGEELQQSVDDAVPIAERLPRGAEENPLSEHVAQIADGGDSRPGPSTLEGGNRVPR